MSAAHVIGRVVGATLLVCGAHFLVRALTGKTPFEHADDWLSGGKLPRLLRTPRPSGPVTPTREQAPSNVARGSGASSNALGQSATPFAPANAASGPPTDPVDESSWESFPASDPPAHSPKNA